MGTQKGYEGSTGTSKDEGSATLSSGPRGPEKRNEWLCPPTTRSRPGGRRGRRAEEACRGERRRGVGGERVGWEWLRNGKGEWLAG